MTVKEPSDLAAVLLLQICLPILINGADVYQKLAKIHKFSHCNIEKNVESQNDRATQLLTSSTDLQIQNLDDILRDLVPLNSTGTLVHITSYVPNIDKSRWFPIILRQPIPLTRTEPQSNIEDISDTYNRAPNFSEFPEWTAFSNNKNHDSNLNMSSPWHTVKRCHLSNMLNGAGEIWKVGKCTHLNMLRFSVATKPWNLEITFAISPPCVTLFPYNWQKCGCKAKQRTIWALPKIWFMEKFIKSDFKQFRYLYSFPSSQPILGAVIVPNNKYFNLLNSHVYEVVRGIYANTMDMAHMLNPIIFLVSVENSYFPKIQQIMNLITIKPNTEVAVHVSAHHHYASKMTFTEPILCQESTQDRSDLYSTTDPVGSAFAKIWLSVIPNLTSFDTWPGFEKTAVWTGVACRNGEKLETVSIPSGQFKLSPKIYFQIVPVESIWQTHFHFENTLQGMRFISCGKQPVNSLPFSELVSIFNLEVWIALVVTGFITALVLKKICRKGNYATFGLLKVVLEQGNPFPDSMLTKHTAMICLLTMLIGVVVSNAYKNVNVYNMIAPRRPIPYKEYDQLHKDNFTVYTRGEISDYQIETLLSYMNSLRDSDAGRTFISYENFQFVKVHMLANSFGRKGQYERFYDMDVASVKSEMTYWDEIPEELLRQNKSKLDSILDRTLLHPFPGEEYLLTVGNKAPNEAKRLAKKLALNSSLTTLRHCNRTAVILPYRQCMQTLRKMLRERVFNVNVGEEKYFEFSGMILMKGLWPQFVVQRLKLVRSEAGLCHRWMHLILSSVYANINEQWVGNSVRSPNMSGNILVIFSVLSAGMMVSVFVFLGEVGLRGYFWMELWRAVLRKTRFIEERNKVTVIEYEEKF